mgnify:CR=1 FL=1
MYGMIHRGIRAMLIEERGEAEWDALEREIGIGPAELVSQSVYDDALTLELVAAVARRLELPIEACLDRFGRYWVRFVDRGAYADIMDFTGRDLVSFIQNLDRMHQAVLAAMPEAKVPSFSVVDRQDGALRVKYQSERTGLEPLVVGLLHGLLDRFGLVGAVQPVPSRGNSAEFVVSYQQNHDL